MKLKPIAPQSSNRTLTVSLSMAETLNGTLLFKANIIAGYVGILTEMKPNAFAITANQRNLNDSIWNNVWYFLHYGALPMTYLARKTLEEEPDYQSAYNRLSETTIIAPVYYILVHRVKRVL